LEDRYKKYSQAVTWFWVQEETPHMGAASFLQMNLKTINYGVISRQPSAATATGYAQGARPGAGRDRRERLSAYSATGAMAEGPTISARPNSEPKVHDKKILIL